MQGEDIYVIYLYEELAKKIMTAKGKVKLSLDLNLTFKEYEVEELREELKDVLSKVRGKTVHVYDGKNLFKLAIYSDHYYALVMEKGFPILEIDGIRMHVFANNPFEYAKKVVNNLNIKGKYILETCFGQGYITRLLKDVKKVITYEISKEVLDIAEWNPYSKSLFNAKNIEIREGDISAEISKIREEFDIIVHDPPTIKVAENLYSLRFYKALYTVAKPKALLYHYIGSPYKARNGNVKKRIIKRLEKAGWKLIKELDEIQGLLLKK